MYVILVYDINLDEKEGSRVLTKVYKICKKYLNYIQNSVFEGELLESQIKNLNLINILEVQRIVLFYLKVEIKDGLTKNL